MVLKSAFDSVDPGWSSCVLTAFPDDAGSRPHT